MTSLIPSTPPSPASKYSAALSDVPPHTLALLYVSNDTNPLSPNQPLFTLKADWYTGTINVEFPPKTEPSTIFTALPVIRPDNPNRVPRPNYGPSYTALTPEQRWFYLNWLIDVSAPVDIGYVFLYYYGLERQLVLGNFDQAKTELQLLLHSHNHNSFQRYANTSLFSATIARQRKSVVAEAFEGTPPFVIEDVHLLAAHRLSITIQPHFFMAMTRNIRQANRRYLRTEAHEFSTSLAHLLTARYGAPAYPLTDLWNIQDLPRARYVLFANSTLPENMRSPTMPSFFNHPPFTEEVSAILADAHEMTKVTLRKRRRLTKQDP